MKGIENNEIRYFKVTDIDSGFKEAEAPDITKEDIQQHRAEAFRDWLAEAIPKSIQKYVCFVDFTVFQDAKIKNPYFYLVAPTAETKDKYQEAVTRLVQGTGEEAACFSVAFHPEFVGIKPNPATNNSFMMISIGEPVCEQDSEPEPVCAIKNDWIAHVYPLWPKGKSNWPPTTKEELSRICGQHPLQECLEKFQSILKEMRQDICDSTGRPVTFVYCIPFLARQRPYSLSNPKMPFSEIAAALFFGLSFPCTDGHDAAVMEFVRSLALMTYRIDSAKKAEEGEITGLDQAIESFAHQIKGVANAMSMKWSVTFDTWEIIKSVFQEDASAIGHLKTARVLPAPQLIEAIRETLILWSQTRRIDDLYVPRPSCFRDVVNKAWDFTIKIRFALGNISRNLGESVQDIKKVWEQDSLIAYPEITGDVDTQWVNWKDIDLEAESRLCFVTRLLVAIFDNSAEHGEPSKPPKVEIKFDKKQKVASVMVSNTVDTNVTSTNSRLRVGMRGNDVLRYLAAQLNAQLTLPMSLPEIGKPYVVKVAIPSLNAFFLSTGSE